MTFNDCRGYFEAFSKASYNAEIGDILWNNRLTMTMCDSELSFTNLCHGEQSFALYTFRPARGADHVFQIIMS